jgi:hypothetical protein
LEEALNALNDLVLEVQDPMAITSNMMCHVGLTGDDPRTRTGYYLLGTNEVPIPTTVAYVSPTIKFYGLQNTRESFKIQFFKRSP